MTKDDEQVSWLLYKGVANADGNTFRVAMLIWKDLALNEIKVLEAAGFYNSVMELELRPKEGEIIEYLSCSNPPDSFFAGSTFLLQGDLAKRLSAVIIVTADNALTTANVKRDKTIGVYNIIGDTTNNLRCFRLDGDYHLSAFRNFPREHSRKAVIKKPGKIPT